jgi:hypothetical protein
MAWKMIDHDYEKTCMKEENRIIGIAKELKVRRWTDSAIIQHIVANYKLNYSYVKGLLEYI